MSAAPQPRPRPTRKPPQSVGETAKVPYFPFEHRLVDDMPWLLSDPSAGCEQFIIQKVLSLVNQRDSFLISRGRTPLGCTTVVTLKDLIKGSPWKDRMPQVAMRILTGGEFPVLRVMPFQEAVEAGYADDVGKKYRDSVFVVFPLRENWKTIVRERKAALAAKLRTEKDDEDEGVDSESDEAPVCVKLTEAPHVFKPGGAPLAIALSRATAIETIEHDHNGEMLSAGYELVGTHLKVFTTSSGAQCVARSENRLADFESVNPSVTEVFHRSASKNGASGALRARARKPAPQPIELKRTPVESPALAELRHAIDYLLLDKVGEPIDDKMLADVARDLGELSAQSVSALVHLIRKSTRKIFSYGYLIGPEGLACKAARTCARQVDLRPKPAVRDEAGAENRRVVDYLRANSGRLAASYPQIAKELEQLARGVGDLDELDQRLVALESRLVAEAASRQEPETAEEIRRKVEAGVRHYSGRMAADQLSRIRSQYLEREILQCAGLPRLSLFYMGGQ